MNREAFLKRFIGATTIGAIKAEIRKKGRRIRSHNRIIQCDVIKELAKPQPHSTKLLVNDGTGTMIVWVLGEREESLAGRRFRIGRLSVGYRKDDPSAKRAYSCLFQQWSKRGPELNPDYYADLVELLPEHECEACGEEHGDRDSLLFHAIRDHGIDEPWPVHLRPLLAANQRKIVGRLVEKEEDCWEKETIMKMVKYHSASYGAEEWKLPRPAGLWLANVLAKHKHMSLPRFYGGNGLTL